MQSITKLLRIRKIVIKIVSLFLIWRITLVIFLYLAMSLIPLPGIKNFFGGGFGNYAVAPEIFSWANFDGEHYTAIAIRGYSGLEQAFFPVYPKLISFLIWPFYLQSNELTHIDQFSSQLYAVLTGLLISHVAFLISLILLWDLVRIDFSSKIATWTIIALLLFPTSFYFGSVYSESVFFVVCLASFYFARKKKWFFGGVFGAIASATRIFGVLILPALIIEVWQEKIPFKKAFWIFLTPLGFLAYMLYQWISVGDFLAFYHLQKLVGEQHQSGTILLPQVYFRYIKMLISVDMTNPIWQTIFLEFATGIIFFLLPIFGYFKKIRLSYVFFALASFLLPTIQGSFSSVPRYVLILFPSFIALAIYLLSLPKALRVMVLLVLYFYLVLETMLFLRGYWVA